MANFTISIINAEQFTDSRGVSLDQLSLAIDLPGYTCASNLRAQFIGADLRQELQVRTVHCTNTTKGAIERALRTWPSYRQGFNVVRAQEAR